MNEDSQIWRVFAAPNVLEADYVTLIEQEHHYVKNVLRLKEGDSIQVGDGRGTVCEAIINKVSKKETLLNITGRHFMEQTSRRVHLVLGRPKNNALEEVVQLCGELGVSTVSVVQAERSHLKSSLRLERLQRIAIETMRINKSYWGMSVRGFSSWEEFFVQGASCDINLLCDEQIPDLDIPEFLPKKILGENNIEKASSIGIFIGPEASFSPEEKDFIREKANVQKVSLGERILRVPTACVAIASLALHF